MGYETIKTSVQPMRIESSIPEVVLDAEPLASARGVLTVRIEGLATSSRASDQRVYETGHLLFVPASGGSQFRWPLDRLDGGPMAIPEIPFGDYSVTLNTQMGFRMFAPVEGPVVSIGSTAAQVHFDASLACEAEILVSTKEDDKYSGELVVRVAKTTGDGDLIENHVVFRGPPYVIDGLIPDLYGFRLERPFDSDQLRFHDMAGELDQQRRAFIVFVE